MDLTTEIREALRDVRRHYGADVARSIERIYRLETAHFTSKQFLNTYSAGMEKHNDVFPYGWHCMEKLWSDVNFAPVGFWDATEGAGILNNGGHKKTFIKFKTVRAAMFSLAEYIKFYSPGRWYSTQKNLQAVYTKKLLTIIPKIVNSLI